MSQSLQDLAARLRDRFGDTLEEVAVAHGEVTIRVPKASSHEVCLALRDEPDFDFATLIDLCGVDYLEYGEQPWEGPRFAVVYHLLSLTHNRRLRVKVFVDEEDPRLESVMDVWSSANWYERECFDLFGILFEGHPDLRRLLTDYGFVGHPFRKDFPLIGHVEMRYDLDRQRVIYEPVSIEPRINVPRVIRHDHRYVDLQQDEEAQGG